MTDYRLPENRLGYFNALYKMNLEHGVMPGLVYLYMPELSRRLGWDAEQRLWFAFLNGMTQNPITSLILMDELPECPDSTWFGGYGKADFADWFNENWDRLQFDTDRRYQKKETVRAIDSYAQAAGRAGGQVPLLTGSYPELWDQATQFKSFGRLAAFSYLEYVHIMGYGADCDNLLFADKSGSRSHRNGALLLMGLDDHVWDKRLSNGHTGAYQDLPAIGRNLELFSEAYLRRFAHENPDAPYVSKFTLESQFCTFKNSFFARRYPGVYADMAWDRIIWAEEHGWGEHTKIFREIREERLPRWLRCECGSDTRSIREKASLFPDTGIPFRAEHFL